MLTSREISEWQAYYRLRDELAEEDKKQREVEARAQAKAREMTRGD